MLMGLLTVAAVFPSGNAEPRKQIRHSVVFKLVHEKGSLQEKEFFKALDKLSRIPGVENFQYCNEISKKNPYDYILSMDFIDQEAYDRYNEHPDHVAFVEQVWLKAVAEFMEIDYTP